MTNFFFLGGLFGVGAYFAEDMTKSDQYADTRFKTYQVFIARVVLGEPHFADEPFLNKLRPPPKKTSVVGLVDTSKEGFPSKGRFREFVIYDKAQAYPQFLVRLERRYIEGAGTSSQSVNLTGTQTKHQKSDSPFPFEWSSPNTNGSNTTPL